MTTQFTISPLGLVTQPNKLGIYPEGAMSRADNFEMLDPGKLTPMRLTTGYVPSISGTGTGARWACAVFPMGDHVFWAMARAPAPVLTTNQQYGNHATLANFAINPVELQQLVKARAQTSILRFKDRLYMLYSTGTAVLDAVDGSVNFTRWAQLPQPLISVDIVNVGAGTALSANAVAGYAAIIRRKYADGYELISAPSPVTSAFNLSSSGPSDVRIAFHWKGNGVPFDRYGVLAGDVVEIYRTREVDNTALGLNVNPGTTLFKVGSYVVVAPSSSAIFTDVSIANAIAGEELYTNPGQETLQSARFPPPLSRCISKFKDYVFYGNVTQPGTWKAAFPRGVGQTDGGGPAARVNGVGIRSVNGTMTITAGNPTITGVNPSSIQGIVPGMMTTASSFPPDARVQSVGATSITMTKNATSSLGPGGFFLVFSDVVEIDGFDVRIGGINELQAGLGFDIDNQSTERMYSMTVAEPVGYYYGIGSIFTTWSAGQRIAVWPFRPIQQSGNGNVNAITVRGTHGANYDPPIPEISSPAVEFLPVQKKNLVTWGWSQQPESVAPAAYAFVGSGEIYAMVETRDVMWIFASDGLWRWTGYGTRSSGLKANWRVDLIDRTLMLAGPNAYCVLRDAVFAYTNIGLVKISDEVGVQAISRGVVGDLLPGRKWIDTDDINLAADDTKERVWININSGDHSATAGLSDCYIWHEQFGIFTKQTQYMSDAIDGALLQRLAFDKESGSMILGISSVTTGTFITWFDPAVNNFVQATGDFQPQFGPDPGSSKQWIDMCVMCDEADAGKLIAPRFNAFTYGEAALVRYSQQKDSRAVFGVSEEAPAVANLLAPGLTIAAQTTVTQLRGIAMRYEIIDEQPVYL